MNRLPRLADIAQDDAGWGFYLCAFKEIRTGRNGGEFLFLALQDSSGQATAKLFSDLDRFRSEVEAGDFVRVEGKATLYSGRVQLVLSTLRRVNPDQDRLQGFREEDCVLSAPRGADEMWAELMGHLGSVRNPHLRVLLNRIVLDNEQPLRIWPAAQQIHHAYRSGLLEHITKMAEVGRFLAKAYDANEDLVLAGVILHDIGKLQELAYDGGATNYTRDGNLVGHIALGLMLVRECANGIADFPVELRAQVEHLIAAHHGTREHGSPVEPKTIEAFIVAAVDELDATLNQVRKAVREDVGEEEFTSWQKRLGRVLYKS